MGAFCTKCGAPLNENGVCPRCSAFQTAGSLGDTPSHPAEAPRPAAPKAAPPVKRPKKRGRLGMIILVLALVLALAVGGVYLLLQHLIKGRSEAPDTAESAMPAATDAAKSDDEPDSDEPEDAETMPDYDAAASLNALGDVEKTVPVTDGKVLTEEDAAKLLRERGFTDEITAPYAMGGKLRTDAKTSGGEKEHPYYVTYYRTDEVLWCITVYNGEVFAEPLTYLNEHPEKPIVLSERETLTAYNSAEDAYYVIQPDAERCELKTVDRIDAETLDELTLREVSRL